MGNKPTKPINICFIGTNSVFSYTAFKTLYSHNATISQVILAGHAPAELPKKHLPVSTNGKPDESTNSIFQFATQHNIPVIFIGHEKNKQKQWQELCGMLPQPDYIFVACFPTKLPSVVFNWPHKKSINLHPSLLPKYRGPDPIFWQLQYNETSTGISLHIINKEFDAGPLLHQHEVRFPVNATRIELDILLAQEGALAFVQLLKAEKFIATAQNAQRATYQSLPDGHCNNSELTDKTI